jgi:hypothetical protein
MSKAPVSDTVEKIMVELQSMGAEDQQALLISLRARKLLSSGIKGRTEMPDGLNAPSMEEIDRIKHLSRQRNA